MSDKDEVEESVLKPAGSVATTAPVKTADRPHWITIIIGVLSPTLAVVALAISLRSLNISEQSMKIGQRAYVAISNGELRVTRLGMPGPPEISAEIKVVVKNLGNTPAHFSDVKIEYVFPKGWNLPSPERRPNHSVPDDITQKGEAAWTYIDDFEITDDAWQKFQTEAESIRKTYEAASRAPKGKPVLLQWEVTREELRIKGDLTYLDVFNEKHHVTWCWVEDPTSRYPKNCPK